ncbi:MAG: Mobile element protein [uncultured Paraburkholderia sp.]|nr:MAG: Mobile element protein [uncultured Paraburkholderia sp.]
MESRHKSVQEFGRTPAVSIYNCARHGHRSTLVTSQIPIEKWHPVLGAPTLADAILDRLVHNTYRVDLSGESMRKHKKSFDRQTPIRVKTRNPASLRSDCPASRESAVHLHAKRVSQPRSPR